MRKNRSTVKRYVVGSDAALRAAEVHRLRLVGTPIRVIARKLAVSVGTVCSDLAAYMHQVPIELAEEARKLDLERCDAMIKAWTVKAKTSRGASTTLRKWMERRARLLGLDILHHRHGDPDGKPIQFGTPLDDLTEEQIAKREQLALERLAALRAKKEGGGA